MYKVLWDNAALEDLKQLDKNTARKIVDKVSNYLAIDPVNLGKSLSGPLRGLKRYRYGNYRIIYELHNTQMTIFVVRIGHRGSVYG